MMLRRMMMAGVSSPPVSTAYADAVAADAPLHWWRLGEGAGDFASSGSSAIVLSPIGSGITRGVAGLVGDSNGAIRLDTAAGGLGSASTVSASGFAANATIELVFRAPSGTSGTLFGFHDGSSPTGTSGARDRTAYIGTDGRLYLGVWTGTRSTIVSPGAVTDGQRHVLQLVLGASAAAGSRGYLDGVDIGGFAAVGTDTSGSRYVYIGRLNFSEWPMATTGGAAGATIDEVAIYGTALSAARCLAHAQAAGLA